MPRVVTGRFRGTILQAPEGDKTRPTTDKVKEALFSIIQSYVQDSEFLDLFAGSGQIGIEALSRGAVFAVFIENDKNAQACIEDNLAHTKFKPKTVLCKQDAFVSLQSLEYKYQFDVIFMDPPYDQELERRVLEYLIRQK